MDIYHLQSLHIGCIHVILHIKQSFPSSYTQTYSRLQTKPICPLSILHLVSLLSILTIFRKQEIESELKQRFFESLKPKDAPSTLKKNDF